MSKGSGQNSKEQKNVLNKPVCLNNGVLPDHDLGEMRSSTSAFEMTRCQYKTSRGKGIGASLSFSHNDLISNQIRHGEKSYQRMRDLPPLLHIFPSEIEVLDKTHPSLVLKMLLRAVRAERARGIKKYWRYSLARHIGLRQAVRAEVARLGDALPDQKS